MKKILLSVAAVMALGTAAQAQDESMSFGVKAGVNFSNFAGDIDDASTRVGFHVGAVAEFKLSETFSIQPEVLFSQQGSQIEYVDEYTESGVNVRDNVENKQTLNYINIPITAKYYIAEGFSIHAGPQVGFLVSAKSKMDMTSTTSFGGAETSVSTESEVDNKDFFKSVDFSVVAGLGYELPMGVFFQARYQAGITSVFEDAEGSDDADNTTTNNVISLSVGFKF